MAAVTPQTMSEPPTAGGIASAYRKFATYYEYGGAMQNNASTPTTYLTSDRALGNVKRLRRHFSNVTDNDTWASGIIQPAAGPATGVLLRSAIKGEAAAMTCRSAFVASTGVFTFRTAAATDDFVLYIWYV